MVSPPSVTQSVSRTPRQVQKVSLASVKVTFLSVTFSLSRNIFGASTRVFSIVKSLTYQTAARPPAVKRESRTVVASQCQNGYLPSKRQCSAERFLPCLKALSPARIVTSESFVSEIAKNGRSPPA